MHYELNFGPAERTPAQRQLIADRALALTTALEQPSAELLTLYDNYVAGETDLYAISVHVGEHLRPQLHTLLVEELYVNPIALSLQTPFLVS